MQQEIPENAFHYTLNPIRLGEFDIGGVLYHANYFHLYEEIREAFLRQIGIPYPSLVEQGQHLAVVESQQKFIRPIRYGQAVESWLWCEGIKQTSFLFNYSFKELDSKNLIHLAKSKHTLVSLKNKTFNMTKMSNAFINALNQYKYSSC